MDQAKIFNSAQGMLKVSQEIKEFDNSLSDLCLYISDKLLKIVECCQPKEEQSCSLDNMAPTPSGSKVLSFSTASEASEADVNKDQICVGHINADPQECRGHGAGGLQGSNTSSDENCPIHGKNAMGQGVDCDCPIHGKNASGQGIGVGNPTSVNEIESDVKDLVSKIRSKMGK